MGSAGRPARASMSKALGREGNISVSEVTPPEKEKDKTTLGLRARRRSTAPLVVSGNGVEEVVVEAMSSSTPTPLPVAGPSVLAPAKRRVVEVVLDRSNAFAREVKEEAEREREKERERKRKLVGGGGLEEKKDEKQGEGEVKVRQSARQKQRTEERRNSTRVEEMSMPNDRVSPPSSVDTGLPVPPANASNPPRRIASHRRSMHLPMTPTSQAADSPLPSPTKQVVEEPVAGVVGSRATSSAPSEMTGSGHGLRSNRAQAGTSAIPFPPEFAEEVANKACLNGDDLADDKLMAVCAALEYVGNRALTAAEVGDVCVAQGWMKLSPAVSPLTVVQSAIRNHQKHCHGQGEVEKGCVINKHTLAGYAVEHSLIPGLHPAAAHDGVRRKGVVYFLDGSYGSVVWENPFLAIRGDSEEDVLAALRQGEETLAKKKSSNRRVKKGKEKEKVERKVVKPVPLPKSPAEADSAPNEEMACASVDVAPRPLKIKLRFGNLQNRASAAELASVSSPPDMEMLSLRGHSEEYVSCSSSDAGGVRTNEELDVRSIAEEEEMDWDMDGEDYAQAVEDYPPYYTSSSALQDDSDYSDEEDELAVPQTASLAGTVSAFARSFFANASGSRQSPLIPSAQPAVDGQILAEALFPTNALDSSFHSEEFVPALVPHSLVNDSSSSEEDEIGTEFMDYGDDAYGIKSVGFDTMNYRDIFSPKEEEEDYSEVDTPATTPRACSDHGMDEAEVPAPVNQCKPVDEALNVDLQNAVQVLGRLLPSLDDSVSTVGLDNDVYKTGSAIPVEHGIAISESSASVDIQGTRSIDETRPRRKSSVGTRDFLRLSLPVPLCPAPSPLGSPFLANQRGPVEECRLGLQADTHEAPPSPTPQSSNPAEMLELDLLADLRNRSPLPEHEPACVCRPDPGEHLPMGSNNGYVYPASPFNGSQRSATSQEAHPDDPFSNATAALLGPESVGVDELDKVWGFVNVLASAEKAKRRRLDVDAHSVSSNRSDASTSSIRNGQEAWGTIGVGCGDGSAKSRKMEKARFARALMSRAKAFTSAQIPTRSRSQSSPRTQANGLPVIEDEEAIGLEDVADAVLTAWANGETCLDDLTALDWADDGDMGLPNGRVADSMPLDMRAATISPIALNKAIDHRLAPTPVSTPVNTSTFHLSVKSEDVKPELGSPLTRSIPPTTAAKLEPDLGTPTACPISQPDAEFAPPTASKTATTKYGGSVENLQVPTLVPSWPPVYISVVGGVSIFAISWQGQVIYRRLDTDYVNFSALLRVLDTPTTEGSEPMLAKLPGSVILRESLFSDIAGVWLPLDVAKSQAEKMDVPQDLTDMVFKPDIATMFPPPLPQLKANLFRQVQSSADQGAMAGGYIFGVPFGCTKKVPRAKAEETPSASPICNTKPSLSIPCVKRAAPSPGQLNDRERPAKRRKSSILPLVNRPTQLS